MDRFMLDTVLFVEKNLDTGERFETKMVSVKPSPNQVRELADLMETMQGDDAIFKLSGRNACVWARVGRSQIRFYQALGVVPPIVKEA